MDHRTAACAPLSVYREFAPRPELRQHVRALAYYGPADRAARARVPVREFYVGNDRELTPSFADAQTSLLFALGVEYREHAWEACAARGATVMGPVTYATQPDPERSAMVAVYLRPRGNAALLGVTAAEITDRVLPLGDVWHDFALPAEQATLDVVEQCLMRRLRSAAPSARALQIAELASFVRRAGGAVSVARMADLAGVSPQHLGRLFLEHIGVAPKLYARLARFRAGLRYVQHPHDAGGWSRLAARLGYADQSHFIAEFREFASFTPEQLASGHHFHPFIGDDAREPAAGGNCLAHR
ncbi:MAG TPA: helix-turn-helix domain-containing protein [Gemmatimonadaceae bacterium]|nr:helix-turn-helix domain-containing protein [Gemmatimonadaceae bacterium]